MYVCWTVLLEEDHLPRLDKIAGSDVVEVDATCHVGWVPSGVLFTNWLEAWPGAGTLTQHPRP